MEILGKMSQIMTKFRMFFFLAWYEIFLLPFDKDIVLMKYAWHLNYSIEVQSFAYHVMEIEVFFIKTWKKLYLWLLFSYKINTRRIKVSKNLCMKTQMHHRTEYEKSWFFLQILFRIGHERAREKRVFLSVEYCRSKWKDVQ